MKRIKSTFLTSLIVAATFALVFLLFVRGETFWAFAVMTICVLVAYPLYYEKTADHPVVLILFSAPLVLIYAFVAMLIRYIAAGVFSAEMIGPICTAVLVYGVLFLVLYVVLYMAISYFLRKMNF